jgi:hypothetical protein
MAQNDVPYERIIQDRFKSFIPKATDSWKEGIKNGYNLELDHFDMVYEMVQVTPANEGKNTLVCGVLAMVAYAKDCDGNKKRVVGAKALCHLFKDDKIVDAVVIQEQNYILLNGWDNSLEI